MVKKILILPSWYPNKFSQTGSFFQEQAKLLNQNGFDIKILMVQELHTKNYCLHRIKRWSRGLKKKLSKDFLLQEPDAYSYPVIIQKSWSIDKKLAKIDAAYLSAFLQLTNQCNWMPDIIHLQGMYKYGLSSFLIGEEHNIPMVVIEHSPFNLNNYLTTYQVRIKKIYKSAKKIAGVSHYHSACIATISNNKKVEVVWNLVDESKFKPSKYSQINTQEFNITTITRNSKEKDPITFFNGIKKFIEIADKRKSININVVGISSLNSLIKLKGISELDIELYRPLIEHLNFYPYLSRSDVKDLLQRSSVFVSTSIEESYGLAIREAMLVGIPVVATRAGGPEDSVNENIGFLIDIGDANALAERLNDLYKGEIYFDGQYLRDFVISQTGRQAYLNRMNHFYNLDD